MEIIVLPNQSLFDISVQHTGNVENSFIIALSNNLTVTDHLQVGSKITIPASVDTNKRIYTNYVINNNQPASARISDLNIKPLEGIGYWEIDNDFIVQ